MRFIFIKKSHRLGTGRNVRLTNVNLCPHGRCIELLWLSRDFTPPSFNLVHFRPIVNQIALASQMHIHGKRMADYTGFVAPRLPYRGVFCIPRKGVPRAYLSRQNDVVNVHDIVPLLSVLLLFGPPSFSFLFHVPRRLTDFHFHVRPVCPFPLAF